MTALYLVRLKRLGDHERPQIGPSDPYVDHILNWFPCNVETGDNE